MLEALQSNVQMFVGSCREPSMSLTRISVCPKVVSKLVQKLLSVFNVLKRALRGLSRVYRGLFESVLNFKKCCHIESGAWEPQWGLVILITRPASEAVSPQSLLITQRPYFRWTVRGRTWGSPPCSRRTSSNLLYCTIIKMPASRVDKFSSVWTNCRSPM